MQAHRHTCARPAALQALGRDVEVEARAAAAAEAAGGLGQGGSGSSGSGAGLGVLGPGLRGAGGAPLTGVDLQLARQEYLTYGQQVGGICFFPRGERDAHVCAVCVRGRHVCVWLNEDG